MGSLWPTQKNLKEGCKVIFTRSKVRESPERNDNVDGVGKEVEKDKRDDERKIKETDIENIILEGEKNEKMEKEKEKIIAMRMMVRS